MRRNTHETHELGVEAVRKELAKFGFRLTDREPVGYGDLIVRGTRGRTQTIVVKASSNEGADSFVLNGKNETYRDESMIYIFVALGKQNTFRIVRSSVVADYVTQDHQGWLDEDPTRVDSDRRVFRDVGGEYIDNWLLITNSLVF